MREILFRGKRKDNGEWICGDLLQDVESGICAIVSYVNLGGNIHDLSESCIFAVIPETVGQYTGLTDKNGTKIFEGDIVKILDFQTGIIINECATFGVGISPFIDWDYLDSKIHTITGCDNNPHFCQNDNFCSLWEIMWNYNQEGNDCSVVEVIGNIYDNPELLKKE